MVRSPTARLSALALAAIAAPAALVAVLGFLSLPQWQTSAELLFREQARDVASMAAQKVDMMLRHAEEAFLDRLQLRLAAGEDTGEALDRLAARAPGSSTPWTARAIGSWPGGPAARRGGDAWPGEPRPRAKRGGIRGFMRAEGEGPCGCVTPTSRPRSCS